MVDFGIARRAPPIDVSETSETSERDATLTRPGAMIGTPPYMAPEQIRGQLIDGRVDQFAWGVVAYELLSGRLPWHETTGVEVFAAILFQDVVPLNVVTPAVGAEVGAIVSRALAKDPDARFASMSDVVAALEPHVATDRATPIPPELAAPTAIERPRPAARRRPRRAIAIGIGIAAIAGGIALGVLRATSEPRATAVTDLPLPATTPEALAAYREGMQAYRDGIFDADTRAFERALALDPGLAAAHLRLAYTLFPGSESDARAHFQRAEQLRASLGEHDQILIDAFEPYIRREPADVAETERRLRDATMRFPRDADFALYDANARFHVGIDPGVDAFRRAVEIDPKFGNAYSYIVEKLLYLRDTAGAMATVETCLREVPSATRCALIRAMSDILSGNCGRVEADARRSIAIDPASSRAYRYLAAAEIGLGRPVQAAQEALEQAWMRIPEPGPRERARLPDIYALAVLRGDFAAAEASARDLERLVAKSPSRAAHAAVARELVDLYEELGRTAEAAELADDFLRRQDAWIGDPRAENFAIARDATVDMLAVLLRTRRLTRAEFDDRRAAWAERWRSVMKPRFVPYIWLHGYAEPTQTADDATAAIAALPRYQPVEQYHPHAFTDGGVGRVYLLAQRLDDGITSLRTAVRSCLATEFPIAHTRAALSLGEALEAKRDTAGACAAYRIVLDRWGGVADSVTAGVARARIGVLGCKL